MLTDNKKQAAVRMLAGAAAGVLAHILLGYLLGAFTLFGPSHFTGFEFPYCNFPYELEWLGVLLSFALWALFGAEVGVATLPFADSGRELVARSLAHYVVTSATVGVWAVLNFHGKPWETLLWFLVPLTLVYAVVWLGRWVGWYAEVAAIREKLGLAPGPSPLHWKETLPYLGFAAVLCVVLPAALHAFDAPDVPVLTGLLLPFLLFPVGGFMSGLSLGRRHGLCPLYPAACGLFYLPVVYILANGSALFHCVIVLCAALAGNLAGAARHRMKKGAHRHEKADPSV